ncbi:MAG TPA: hypothetical protein P5060_01170 [Candidatus Absconditabacterales bacterium]|nr:hypothetical protein [Candidatus Absconditabacterales bacterium]
MNKITKIILSTIITILSLIGLGFCDFDLKINSISLSDGGNTVSLFSNPKINIDIYNNGPDNIVNNGNIGGGFIRCQEMGSQNTIFNSSSMSTFIVNNGTNMIAGNLELPMTLTQTPRTIEIKCIVNEGGQFNGSFTSNESNYDNNSSTFSFNVEQVSRFDISLDRSIEPIRQNLDASESNSMLGGGDSVKNFIFKKLMNVITPLVIVVGIIIGIIGAYRLMFSSSAEETKNGVQLIVYGIIGIIIILSAKYIGSVIFEDIFQSGNTIALNGVDISTQLYEKIAYPFIKIVVYLALGGLFVVIAAKAFSFITKGDESSPKKAATIIGWSTIGMLIIIGAKQIVEAIYGKKSEVLNTSAQNLGEIGTGLLADKNIPLLYSVINWVMGLTSLVVLVIIIFQTFQILTNPEKADNRQKIGKSIIYIFVGILIIGAGYLLTNFLVIN